ncbi:MAG: hypothetical protein KGP35_00190 [Bacteroidetes bacterium]|nr:hypothetical protein [Bacteroidota bacterium]
MNTAQLEKKLLEHTKNLSKEALREVIDFVRFLQHKMARQSSDYINIETSSLNKSQIVHLEEEFEDYKKLYPRE